MQKWEYNLLVQSPNTECARCEEALNGLGRDGWELVTFYVNGGDSQCPLWVKSRDDRKIKTNTRISQKLSRGCRPSILG
jgi:hypothetical protein